MSMTDRLPHDGHATARSRRVRLLGVPFDRLTFAQVVAEMRMRRSGQPFGYVVTPNVDHIVKLSREDGLASVYDDAWLSLCDSKPVWAISRYLEKDLDHVTGSDLTARMFEEVVRAGDAVALIVASPQIAQAMTARFPELRLRIHVPPPQISGDRSAFDACVDFLAREPARFMFIGVGAPQSERIAQAFGRRAGATGTALCVGASLEFILGMKVRAPRWMRAAGLEWLHRLVSEPRRLWRRYILAVLPLAALVVSDIRRNRVQGA